MHARVFNARLGSPPRAWGRLGRANRTPWPWRFTPTCVGTAGGVPFTPNTSPYGSPPRAWGRLEVAVEITAIERFTPTCVGTASGPRRLVSIRAVHPHVRGDGAQFGRDVLRVDGSPPRAWGRQADQDGRHAGQRFTPTCVGTAPTPPTPIGRPAVHPHVRGDGGVVWCAGGAGGGSPPRAWGRRRILHDAWGTRRFTPTCVGTAATVSRCWLRRPVHPHVRGDGAPTRVVVTPDAGSPPRAWGRQAIDLLAACRPRFTPTCVGTATCCTRPTPA